MNTISFEFHSVDYSDPSATSVKYKLIGIDDDYVESKEAQGFARYANLPPGKYTFAVLGANSDGVWNTQAKEINITIKAPFWQTWWFISLFIFTSALFIFWLFRTYYRRKLEKKNIEIERKNHIIEKKNLIIENQQAVENERTRIASEMHDDLGSGLTTIRYLSDKALKQAKDAEEAGQIKRIADHSNTLVRNMSEIIWAMNSRYDNTENLIGYLRRYASEYLDERQMPFKFESEDGDQSLVIGGEKRRNIFLVFKELLHNTVKYSEAQSVLIKIETRNNFTINISEIGGKGFNPIVSVEKGNGLFNCQKRLKSIDGQLAFEKTSDAMNIIISVPVNSTTIA
ncbi:MAG TPA: triple tyrosine motif-containing protein, partial [Saprospiraceae bacterium]|nr:triple tyrosine motif-containing protein [Saprospiraceae bacterium]